MFYHLIFGDKSVRVLGLLIQNNLHETLKDELSFQTFDSIRD